MHSLPGGSECARDFAIYRSQSRAFVIGSGYFSRASYIMQTNRLMPRTAPHLLWEINCV